MHAHRLATLALAALLVAATGCGKSNVPDVPGTANVTLVGGAADGSDVTVDGRWCVRCHGDASRAALPGDAPGAAFAPPLDVAGAATGARVGAHLKHLQAGAIIGTGVDCATCHVVPATADAHVPGVLLRRVAQAGNASPVFEPGAAGAPGTCSATYCHGAFAGGAGDVALGWGDGPLGACGTACHQTPPPNGVHAGLTFPADCLSCHGNTLNPDGTIKTAGGLHVNGVVDGGCTACHGTDARANGGIAGVTYDVNQAAAPPVKVETHTETNNVLVGAHLAHVNPTPSVAGATQPTGGVYKPIACTECHPDNTAQDHPDDARATVTFALATGADLAGFPPSLTAAGNGTSVPVSCSTYCHAGVGGGSATTPAWNGAAAACGSCHAFPPASHTGVTANATECNGCHDGTVNVDGTINVAGGLHINGQVDGGESTGGQACGGCHDAILSGITAGATSRHALTLDDPALQTGITWSSPLSNNAPAVRSCTNMCHDDHPHTAGGADDHSYNAYADANQRATSATTSTRARTDFDGGAGNGGLCVSCHRFPVTGVGPTIDKAAYAASAHAFTSFTAGSTWTWQFALHKGAFARNCTKCHASNAEGRTPSVNATNSAARSVHFNVNDSLLAGSTTLSQAVTDLVCYNCHGSTAAPAAGVQGNRSGKNIQGQFAKASNHVGTDVTCMSCHDPHLAQAGTHATPGNLAGPPVEGASGAEMTGSVAFWTAPTAGAFTAVPRIAAGSDLEATLCFKCHTAFKAAIPAGAVDVAREFNPANVGNYATTGTTSWQTGETAGGFHPVLADAGGNLGRINMANLVTSNFAWRTSGARNLMACTDCHESDTTTDPNGPHGSAAGFLLRGPNTGWNNTIAALSTGMPANTFCANCHSSSFASSRMPSGDSHTSRSAHRVACQNCHARVPHGGPRPGMLVAPAGAEAAVGGSISTWDSSSTYANPGSGSRLYLKSYPATGTSAWQEANCGCNGTGH